MDKARVLILVDMPVPLNITVHLCNEHNILPGELADPAHDKVLAHLRAHLYGRFREGSEHYHNEDERA